MAQPQTPKDAYRALFSAIDRVHARRASEHMTKLRAPASRQRQKHRDAAIAIAKEKCRIKPERARHPFTLAAPVRTDLNKRFRTRLGQHAVYGYIREAVEELAREKPLTHEIAD
jgi:hypothetical protein